MSRFGLPTNADVGSSSTDIEVPDSKKTKRSNQDAEPILSVDAGSSSTETQVLDHNKGYPVTEQILLAINDKHVLRFHRCLASGVKQDQIENDSSSSSSSESEGDDDPKKLKLKILNEALKYVPEYGWSKQAIVAGAEELGLPGVAHGMLSKGGADLVFYFNYSCNRKLEAILKEKVPPNLNRNDDINHSFLFDALKTRLEMNIPYLPKWPEALALMALPHHALSDIEHAMDLVDTIWFYTGDKSIYVKWYSRRLSVAGMYKLSELYLCQDSSESYANTWKFLEDNVETVINTDASISEVQNDLNAMKEICGGAAITARNLFGLNRLFR